jgi:hypothetical protein
VAPIDRDYADVPRLTCPNCGIDTEEDYDAIYVTCFIGGYGKHTIEAPFCGACAAIKRSDVLTYSAELDDQWGAAGGPPPNIAGEDVLRALGIQPRGTRS